MTAITLLDALAHAGIRLGHDGDELYADVQPGADLEMHRAAIAEHKPALLNVLALQDAIVAAVTVEPFQFDRPAYDALWARWHALEHEERDP
jgi:hypothetical protein